MVNGAASVGSVEWDGGWKEREGCCLMAENEREGGSAGYQTVGRRRGEKEKKEKWGLRLWLEERRVKGTYD